MARWSVLSATAVVVIAAAFVTGASVPAHPSDQSIKCDNVKTIPTVVQRFGFFNMTKIGIEYCQNKKSVKRLNDRKNNMADNLSTMKQMYQELLRVPRDSNPSRQAQADREKILLARQIQDADSDMNKQLKKQTSMILAELYDEIHAVTVEIAHERRLSAILAYPDPATPDEPDSTMEKEVKLNPAACVPFFLDPAADYTDEIIERLIAKFGE
jgi:Skp family chaperone for outer membrane proteins